VNGERTAEKGMKGVRKYERAEGGGEKRVGRKREKKRRRRDLVSFCYV
jgi:hypothetical protein